MDNVLYSLENHVISNGSITSSIIETSTSSVVENSDVSLEDKDKILYLEFSQEVMGIGPIIKIPVLPDTIKILESLAKELKKLRNSKNYPLSFKESVSFVCPVKTLVEGNTPLKKSKNKDKEEAKELIFNFLKTSGFLGDKMGNCK